MAFIRLLYGLLMLYDLYVHMAVIRPNIFMAILLRKSFPATFHAYCGRGSLTHFMSVEREIPIQVLFSVLLALPPCVLEDCITCCDEYLGLSDRTGQNRS